LTTDFVFLSLFKIIWVTFIVGIQGVLPIDPLISTGQIGDRILNNLHRVVSGLTLSNYSYILCYSLDTHVFTLIICKQMNVPTTILLTKYQEFIWVGPN